MSKTTIPSTPSASGYTAYSTSVAALKTSSRAVCSRSDREVGGAGILRTAKRGGVGALSSPASGHLDECTERNEMLEVDGGVVVAEYAKRRELATKHAACSGRTPYLQRQQSDSDDPTSYNHEVIINEGDFIINNYTLARDWSGTVIPESSEGNDESEEVESFGGSVDPAYTGNDEVEEVVDEIEETPSTDDDFGDEGVHELDKRYGPNTVISTDDEIMSTYDSSDDIFSGDGTYLENHHWDDSEAVEFDEDEAIYDEYQDYYDEYQSDCTDQSAGAHGSDGQTIYSGSDNGEDEDDGEHEDGEDEDGEDEDGEDEDGEDEDGEDQGGEDEDGRDAENQSGYSDHSDSEEQGRCEEYTGQEHWHKYEDFSDDEVQGGREEHFETDFQSDRESRGDREVYGGLDDDDDTDQSDDEDEGKDGHYLDFTGEGNAGDENGHEADSYDRSGSSYGDEYLSDYAKE